VRAEELGRAGMLLGVGQLAQMQEALECLAVVPGDDRGVDRLHRKLDAEVHLVEVQALGHVHGDVAHHVAEERPAGAEGHHLGNAVDGDALVVEALAEREPHHPRRPGHDPGRGRALLGAGQVLELSHSAHLHLAAKLNLERGRVQVVEAIGNPGVPPPAGDVVVDLDVVGDHHRDLDPLLQGPVQEHHQRGVDPGEALADIVPQVLQRRAIRGLDRRHLRPCVELEHQHPRPANHRSEHHRGPEVGPVLPRQLATAHPAALVLAQVHLELHVGDLDQVVAQGRGATRAQTFPGPVEAHPGLGEGVEVLELPDLKLLHSPGIELHHQPPVAVGVDVDAEVVVARGEQPGHDPGVCIVPRPSHPPLVPLAGEIVRPVPGAFRELTQARRQRARAPEHEAGERLVEPFQALVLGEAAQLLELEIAGSVQRHADGRYSRRPPSPEGTRLTS